MLKNYDTLHKYLCGIVLAFFACCFVSCSDDDDATNSGYDPTKSVAVTDFIPKSGGVGQKLVIYGDNFGNDKSKVNVTIGGKQAVLINVKNNGLYCFVPQGAYSEIQKDEQNTETYYGEIKITVGDEETGTQSAVASQKFVYEPKMVVGRLCGYRNEHDDQGWHDGSFSECTGFAADAFMKYDPLYPERLYIVYDNGSPGVQLVDFANETVTSILSKSKFEDKRLRTIDFTLDGQYMIVATDRDDRGLNSPSVWAVKRNEDGTFNNDSQAYIIASYKQCNGAVVHPQNGELYFNSYENGQVFRLDLDYCLSVIESGDQWDPQVTHYQHQDPESDSPFKQLFTIQDTSWEFNMTIHPSGDYAYINVINQHYMLRTDYDRANHRFAAPYIVAGGMKSPGWEDGVGTSARINRPYQGIFVKNQDYVDAGRSDVYDYYFCDNQNHAVRLLTPDGIIRTFAGRGSRTSAADNNIWGTDNGDLREVARFRDPTGIAYNEDLNTFYILDTVGRSLRTIAKETSDVEEPGNEGDTDDNNGGDSDTGEGSEETPAN